MKKIKSLWDSNRVLFVLTTILILCFVIMAAVCFKYFFGSASSSYGDRLESIQDLPLEDSDKESIIAKFQESDSVNDVAIHTQGKIIYIRVTFQNVTAERAKEIANPTLEMIPEKYLENYDIHYTLVSEATETTTGFIVMGAKNIGESQNQIIWSNVITTDIVTTGE